MTMSAFGGGRQFGCFGRSDDHAGGVLTNRSLTAASDTKRGRSMIRGSQNSHSAVVRAAMPGSDRQEGASRGRRRRTLCSPPSFRGPSDRASLASVLSSSALPENCRPEYVDASFKAHLSLLRRLTHDSFENHNRYMFIYKPLARANAVLAASMLMIPDADTPSSSGSPMSAELRSAVLYIACNSMKSVYGMAYAGQMTSAYKGGPPVDGQLNNMVVNGFGLLPEEEAALDFAQHLSSLSPKMLDATCRSLHSTDDPSIGAHPATNLLERQVAGVVAYAAFLCRAHGALDVELSYDAVKYAATNLSHSLQWSPAGRHFDFAAVEDIADVNGPARAGFEKKGAKLLSRRVPRLISSSVTVSRILAETNRAQDTWLAEVSMPKAGKLLEFQDCITASFGFTPFYLSVSAVLGETQRRALLYGARQLLFRDEGELSPRLKFLVSFVVSTAAERALQSNRSGSNMYGQNEPDNTSNISSRPLPSRACSVDQVARTIPTTTRRRVSVSSVYDSADGSISNGINDGSVPSSSSASTSTAQRAADCRPVGPPSRGNMLRIRSKPKVEEEKADLDPTQHGYDALEIMKAHAAFLATKHGATAAELVAAVDEESVLAAMERYLSQPYYDDDLVAFPVGFPLTKKDCATVLLAHSLSKSPPDVSVERLQFFQSAYGKRGKGNDGGGRSYHRAILEVVGAASMWGMLERYCAGAVSFDVDYSANLYFAGGHAEPTITKFVRSPIGREIGLQLGRRDCCRGDTGRVLERANTVRNVMSVDSVHFKDRFLNRSHRRSTSFLASAGEKVGRVFKIGSSHRGQQK